MAFTVWVLNDHKLFLTYLQGPVPLAQLYGSADEVVGAVTETGTYRGLLIFDRDVELGEWDGAAIRDLRRRGALIYRRLGLQRGQSAAVVDVSPQAHHVIRLWNALAEFNLDMNMAFNVFFDIQPALKLLDVPAHVIGRMFGLTPAVHR